MAKISVRHSVAQAYGLLFGRPLTVIGLTWLPAVFYAVGADFLIHRMDAAMAVAVPSANGLFGQYAFFYFIALVVATAFYGAVIAVPLTKQAFGLREEQVAVHLVVGAREFRLFFGYLRYYAIAVTTLVVLAIGAGVAITQGMPYAAAHGLPAVWHGYPLETWANSIAGAITVIIFSVIAVRYSFFLDAIAAVEDHAKLRRAASLSRGNFWPIATTLFVVGVPALLVLLACEMTFGGLNLNLSSLGLAAADTTPFAGILAAGLAVLHTLLAGASAGAYAEMAEQIAQDSEPYEPVHAAPAAVYAQAPAAFAAPAETAYQAEVMQTAPPEIPPMEIATPEAETVHAAAAAPAADWMPPPPDAHFGADPHDTQLHELNLHHEAAAEALVAQTEAHPIENTPVETGADVPADAAAAEQHGAEPIILAEHVEEGMDPHPGVMDTSAAQAVGFDGHPVPEHAHTAEFPPPPLDPAGVLSAQSGFHSPPPG
jgi:hypothetical protein